MARPTGRPVREELLAAATTLIQRVGVSGFSYNKLADDIGIRAPSIHHHFRRKEDLIAAVALQYRCDFASQVASIADTSVRGRLQSYAKLFAATATNNRMCLCGAVAAEWLTAGDAPRVEVEAFFADQVAWLSAQIDEGINSGELRPEMNPNTAARAILAALEGAVLLNRAINDSETVTAISDLVLTLIEHEGAR